MFPLGLILLLVISSQCRSVENSENVPEYLVRRLRETKVQIAKALIQRDTVPVISSSYDTQWVNLWSRKLHKERTLMVRTFNKMCILEGNRIISVAIQPATKETNSELQEVALIRQERPVKFIKSIFWKSKLYLLVCYDDDNACGLYTGNNEVELKHKQIIKDKGWPMDATFFTRGNRLYLVVAHNTDQYPVSSVIYHWTGTYMDVIHQPLMVGVVSVTAFNYKNSTIIIFGQNVKQQPDIGSGIYKFDDNRIDVIQYLPTNGPTSIHYYTHKEQIFLVVMNEIEASNVYWWDGNEFLHWLDLPSIVAPSMVNVAHFSGDTLFFVSYESQVTVYKVSSSEYLRLNLLELKNGERVVDMGVWTDERGTLTLLLITVDPKNLYRIEPWELRMKKKPQNANLKEAEQATEHCLADLESRLNKRVTPMENLAHKTWPLLLPSAKNINIGALNGSNRLGKLILHSGSIAKLDVFSSGGILLGSEIETLAESSGAGGSRTIVNSILEESRKTMKIHGANRLVGDVIIRGNAVFQGLQTNSIHTELFNGQSINLQESVISKTKNQIFSNAQLRGKNISVQELQIDQLCGIPYEYWLRGSNEKSDNIFLKNNPLDINNDTILLKTDLLTINRLNLRSIDGVELNSFFKDLFIPGKNQRIQGNIIQSHSGILKVGDLIVENLNGFPQKDLMTIHTNQNLENNVFAKTMLIQNLVAKKVNGVAVSESAMVSKENHIKGHVTIASMRILDELAIENPSEFPKVRPVQVYDQVTIIGDLKSEDLSLDPHTNFYISLEDGSVIEQSNIHSILDSYWTKSSSQIIENDVFFDAGLTVDELTVEYLNDLNISEDIMLTTIKEINEDFPSLEFMNFTTSGWIVEETEDPDSAFPLWSSTDKTLFINEEFRIERLGAQYLNIETFNGIPVVEIMNRNLMVSGPYKYPVDSVQRFDTVTVNERLETEDLDLRFVNGQQELPLQDLLKFDANYTMKYLKAEQLTLENIAFVSETGNESELHKFVNYHQEFTNSSELEPHKEFSLIIDGQLVVENDLKVNVINHQSTETYLEDLASQDFSISSEEQLIIDRLVVHHNLSVNFLHGSRFESLFQSILLKSREQNLSDSRLSFYKISVDDLRTEKINKRLTSNFVYTDSYDIEFGGNVTFTDLSLSLDEDTQTKSLNGYPLNTLYNRLGEIDLLEIKDFTVKGNVSWESGGWSLAGSELQLGPLDTIIKNALIKSSESSSNAPQVIYGQTRINSPREESPGVSVRWMKYKQDNSKLPDSSFKILEGLQGIDMSQIVYDAVLDDPSNDKAIEIISKKNFAQDLKASRLNVAGEIGIDSVNNWNVNDLYSSVIRKESLNSLISEKTSSRNSKGRASRKDNQPDNLMIFRDQISVKKLVIQPNNEFSSVPVIHEVPVTSIVLSTTEAPDKYLPNNTHFKHVEIKGNAFVKSLDNVDLDEFVNDRVTIHSNHEVHGNLQFNGRVQVSQGAKIHTINDILPSDFVINNSHEDQIIVGEKTFNGDIEINGKTYAPSVAGINFKEEYDNGVLSYEETDIFGDIIFKADIDRPVETINSMTRWQLNSAGGGLVNGMRLKSFLNDRDIEEENILRGLKRNESRLELSVIRASNASSHLPEIFYYFESEDDLAITAAKIDRVEVIKIEELTILNLYANELPSYCGLKDKCPCRRQYVAEITSNGCDSHEIEGSRIVYNFHEPHGVFGVTVTTTSVSSSKTCTTAGNNSSLEFTTISWIKSRPGNPLGEKITENAMKIYGYLSDVKVFTQNDLIFIVLAIYYDPIEQSHETNSLIYVLDVTTNELKLTQGIPTSHATGVQVFKIPSKGAHILFTSFGGSEFGKSSVSLLYRLEPSTVKFELLRTFTTGGNRHVKSVSQPKDEFLFLDDVATNSIHVYVYNPKWDNFDFYQSLYHNSMAPISSIETLYAGEFRRSQVYVIVTTKHDQFFVYEYKYFAKFQLIAQKKTKGILTMVPFDVSSRRYMFVGTETNSTILRVIEQGRN